MKNYRKSRKQEKNVAKELEARPVIASGALWGAKGDVRHDGYLIECKTTEKDYYVLSKSTWAKIRREAIRDGIRVPLMSIDLQSGEARIAVYEEGMFPSIPSPEKVKEVKQSIRVDKEHCILKFEGSYTLVVTDWEYVVEQVLKEQ